MNVSLQCLPSLIYSVWSDFGKSHVMCLNWSNRFDLIFLMLDPQDEQFDRRLATHLVSLYHRHSDEEEADPNLMPMSDLRDYIAYARSFVHPKLSEEAGEALIRAYVGMFGG